jgi:hypothetical protein
MYATYDGKFEMYYKKYDFKNKDNPVINLTKKEWDFITKDLKSGLKTIPYFAMGLDGCTYTVSISNGFNVFEYTLWSPKTNQSKLCVFINNVLSKIGEKEYLIKY